MKLYSIYGIEFKYSCMMHWQPDEQKCVPIQMQCHGKKKLAKKCFQLFFVGVELWDPK